MADYEIVIIGTGAGGGTLAYALAKSGKKILLIERGGFLPREKDNWNSSAVVLDEKYKTEETWLDRCGKAFTPGMHYFVGGNTKVYGAALLRLRKEDFGEINHFGGVSPAWPLSYEEFEPYYTEAERLYQVHGERGLDPTEPPCSAPYAYPPVSHEKRILELKQKLEKEGYHPFHLPLGLMLNEEKPAQSACIRCDTCDGFPCLVHAKSDAEVMCVTQALRFPNVTLQTKTQARRLVTDPSGKKVVRIEVLNNGKKEEITADLFVLSCGAVNSAALLLASHLANSSGLVGKNYMHHLNSALVAISTIPNKTRYQKTLALNDFYFSSPEWEYPLGHIQLLGNIKMEMLKNKAPVIFPRKLLEGVAGHTVGWWLTSEDLPEATNCVRLDSTGKIILDYRPNNLEGHRRLVKKLKQILKKIEPTTICFSETMPLAAVAHQVGTCRFGQDPKSSVLDCDCKAHDLDNVYVVDGSFFPSSGAVNPGLTIIANALRVAKKLI